MSLRTSVVIPAYNAERDIAAAIDSALAQRGAAVEVCVLDDGSTDSTPNHVARYGDRVRYARQPNRGLAAARNAGGRLATGDAILFLDADDALAPDCIARHADVLAAQPRVGLTYSRWLYVDEGARTLSEAQIEPPTDVQAQILRRTLFFFPSAVMIRRSWLDRAGWFDESLCWSEDADLWLRLARAGCEFAFIDAALTRYRIRTDSMTAQVKPEHVHGWRSVLDKTFADPALPAHLRALRGEAHGILHLETAGRYLRAGDPAAARASMIEAERCWPGAPDNRIVEWAVGTAVHPRTVDALALIAAIFDMLPLERQHLRGRAIAHVHAALALECRRARQTTAAWRHGACAVRGDVTWLANRGFVRQMVLGPARHRASGRGT